MAQWPQPVGGLAGRRIGHAGFPQMPVGGAEAALDVARRQCGKGFEEPVPDRARRPVRRAELIGNAGQANIVAGPLRHPPIAPTGPFALTLSVTTSLASA